MGKGKKATVSAGKKESNGKKKENDVTNNIMATEPPKKQETDEPPPPTPLPLLIDEEQDDNKQKDDSLDIDREPQQSEQGVEASIEKEEAKVGNDKDDDDNSNVVDDNNNNTAGIVQDRQRMKWQRGLLFISTLAFLLAVSNGYTLYLYKQTQTEKQALVLTAETLREGNMEVSRYYKRQLNRMEKDAQQLENQISIYQLHLQKAMLAETEKQRDLQEQLHRQVQNERITCEKRLEQEQEAHEQVLQTQIKMSSQQQHDFDQQWVQFKKQAQQVEDELHTVQSQLQTANEMLAQRQAEIKIVQEENEKLAAFKSKATLDLEKGRKANRNLVHEFETCKVQLGTMQKQKDNWTREKNEIQQALPLLIMDLQKCRTENAILIQDLNHAQEQLNNYHVHLIIVQETVSSLGQDLEEQFSHLETISKTKQHILRETIATLELERQQFNATLKRTRQDLLQVQHVIDEKLIVKKANNERSIMEQKLVPSPPTAPPPPPPPPPRQEEQKQHDPPRNSSSSAISRNISDAPPTDNNQVDIGDSSADEEESDEDGDGDKVTTAKKEITVTLDEDIITDHNQQGDAEAVDEKDSNNNVTLDGDTTTTVSQNVEEIVVGGSDATGGAKDEADASMMTDAMIQDGVQGTSDAHGLKAAGTVEQEPAAMNLEESAAFVESTCSPETPVEEEAIESMDEDAKTEQDDQQDDETSTAEDPSASATTHQAENKGKRNVVKKLQNFWRGLMKRKVDKKTLDLALD